MKSMLVLALVLTIRTQWVSADGTGDFHRTVIFIQKKVGFGESVFLRGGIDHDQRDGCTRDAETSACAIPIRHDNTKGVSRNAGYSAWSTNDTKLDWYGAESNQLGTFGCAGAKGTPMVWTTNYVNSSATVSEDGYGYTPLNTFGEDYWMADLDIDCSKTKGRWFELKGFVDSWEGRISQDGVCQGDAGLSPPSYKSGNHFARCGFLNAFVFNTNGCYIDVFPAPACSE